MNAILELIKTLIPFGIAFLFLWGIGRVCCTTGAKTKQPNGKQAKSSKKEPESDEKMTKSKNRSNKKKKKFDSKKEIFSQKKDMFSSHKDIMDDKSSLFTSRKSMINKSKKPISEIDVILSLPQRKQRKLKPLQKAYLLKEVLDSPKAIKPYRKKYPR